MPRPKKQAEEAAPSPPPSQPKSIAEHASSGAEHGDATATHTRG